MSYLIAAYGVTGVSLVLYGLLLLRERRSLSAPPPVEKTRIK
jgi:hypothetical protein